MSGLHPLVRKIHAQAVPVSTAGNTDVTVIGPAPFAGKVTSVSYIPKATVTGAATNNRSVAVVNKKLNGSGTTTVASLTFGSGTNAAAFDEKSVDLSGTVANHEVAEGDVLAFTSTPSGTGITDPGGLVVVTIARS